MTTETSDSPTTDNIGKTLGNYRIMREAGWGSLSTVYQAVDTRIGRMAALKVLPSLATLPDDQRKTLIRRLEREAKAIARLSHPNVVTVFDIGEQDGDHYIAMEYLQGRTLRERLDTGPLPLAEASEILDQVADALDAVHGRGVVHRDLKPSNVMLLPEGRVKLMDFGSAHLSEDANITQLGGIVGSPAYLAPERLRGGPGTPSSDLWAVGVLLYEMLSGHPPFQGTSIPSILHQVAQEEPTPLTDVPPKVRQVVARALEKDPAKRFHSAREMADALRAALPGRTTPAWVRVWQWGALPLAVLVGALLAAHQFGLSPKGNPALPPAAPLRTGSITPMPLPPPTSVMQPTPPAGPLATPPKRHSHRHHHHHADVQPVVDVSRKPQTDEAPPRRRHHKRHHHPVLSNTALAQDHPKMPLVKRPQAKPTPVQKPLINTPAPGSKPPPPTTVVGGSQEFKINNPAPTAPVNNTPAKTPQNHADTKSPPLKTEVQPQPQGSVLRRANVREPTMTLQEIWYAMERFIWGEGR